MEAQKGFFNPRVYCHKGTVEYVIYICSGKGENYRESGAYTHSAESFLDAAKVFGDHWNNCLRTNTYGSIWKEIGQREGNPKEHSYLQDEKGNTLLIIKRVYP